MGELIDLNKRRPQPPEPTPQPFTIGITGESIALTFQEPVKRLEMEIETAEKLLKWLQNACPVIRKAMGLKLKD